MKPTLKEKAALAATTTLLFAGVLTLTIGHHAAKRPHAPSGHPECATVPRPPRGATYTHTAPSPGIWTVYRGETGTVYGFSAEEDTTVWSHPQCAVDLHCQREENGEVIGYAAGHHYRPGFPTVRCPF